MITVFGQLPRHLRRSLTWDQGIEMARHGEFSRAVDMPVFFCHRASPWERGTNENTNGLLRDYFPKGTDLFQHSADYLAHVADELNHRPRRDLQWAKPAAPLRYPATTTSLRRRLETGPSHTPKLGPDQTVVLSL